MLRRTVFITSVLLSQLATVAAVAQQNAQADENANVISFSADDPSCPSATAFEQRFRTLVGADASHKGSAKVSVTRKDDGSFEVSVNVQTGEQRGERRVVTQTCQLAADAAALIAAISLFPERAAQIQERAESSKTPETETPPAPSEKKPPVPAPAPKTAPQPLARQPIRPRTSTTSANQWGAFVSVAGALDVGSMPDPALGLAASVGTEFKRVSIELAGSFFFEQTTHRTTTQSATFSLQNLSLSGCYAFSSGAWIFSPCVGAIGFRIVGSGEGTTTTNDETWFYGGPTAGAALRFSITHALRLQLHAHGFAGLDRPRFLLEKQEIHRPSLIGLWAFVGPELRF